MPLTLVHHHFSVDDYEQMIAFGILTENDRVELIRGEIIDKMPIGDEHCACVKRLNRLLNRAVGDRALVSVQDPVRLPDSEPEPDLALLRPREDFYASGKPRPNDVLLLIEVADTTLEYDREVKRALYAEVGIQEYWIVNLSRQALEVHRQPQPDGSYGEAQILERNHAIAMIAFPDLHFTVADLLFPSSPRA